MLNLSAPAKLHLMIINYMSTTHCGTNIVRIRVGLLNDILRFDYALRIFFSFSNLLLRIKCYS